MLAVNKFQTGLVIFLFQSCGDSKIYPNEASRAIVILFEIASLPRPTACNTCTQTENFQNKKRTENKSENLPNPALL